MTSDTALAMAVQIVKEFEGCRLAPYQDIRGRWTIGYGNCFLADGTAVSAGTPAMTEQDAVDLLVEMLTVVDYKIRSMVTVPLSDGMEAALYSFAWNEGVPALHGSTLLRLLNAGNTQGAADQFASWVYSGGHIEPGLVNRRARERQVFLGDLCP